MYSELIISELFKTTLNEALSFLKSKSSNLKNLDKIKVEDVYQKSANIENVKTIWQVDKSVNLNEFYYPSAILVEDKTIEMTSLNVFPENGKIVIQGTAGQGKSILLRYLSGSRLKEGSTIPIFVELRKITPRNNIKSLISTSISELGINIEEKNLEYIYESNKFSLLFDAFDEIPESEIQDTINYIDTICAKHPRLQIIITSRPGAEVQKISYFSVYNLNPLQVSDFKPMLMKFFNNNEETVNNILKSLHENNSSISELINTPLLLTLLAITYKSYNKIPSQLHEFYENIFHVLVNRHDASKPGFKREYKSELNERELENLFCAFCFYSMLQNNTSLSRHDASSAISKAKAILNINLNSDFSFLSDCIRNTCLLLEEGFNYHFIHKSIREYHSAKFISTSPIELKERFYNIALLERHSIRYNVELEFLKVIDRHYYNKYYYLPKNIAIFNELGINDKYSNLTSDSILQDANFQFNKIDDNEYSVSFTLGKKLTVAYGFNNRTYNSIVNELITKIDFDELRRIAPQQKNDMLMIDHLNSMGLIEHFDKLINENIKRDFEEFTIIKNDLERQKELILNMEF